MTHYRTLFDAGRYLASWHIPRGKDTTVEIESVTAGVLKKGTKETRKPLIKFVGKKLLFACNVTNGKVIDRMYGADVEQWVGKKITLYVGKVKNPEGGGTCDGICVRPRVGESGGDIDETVKAPDESTTV